MRATSPIRILGVSLQEALDRLCRKHKVCGASVAILKDGVVHAAASGWANARERIEATPDTVFQIGSISKVFTATLAMQLVDESLLDIDAPVRRYLPEFRIRDKSAGAAVTVRQLLTHTSGIEGDFYPAEPPGGANAEYYLSKLRGIGQLHPPGAYVTYNNAGYVVLARIIEILRGAEWNELVMRRICIPLGMTHAMARPPESLRFRMAMGHRPYDQGEWAQSPDCWLPSSMAGAGSALSMTATDLMLFARAHLQGPGRKAGRHSILSQKSFRAMQAPQVRMPPYSRGSYTHMGLAWFIQPDAKAPRINHDGATSQFAFLHLLPKQDVAIVLLTNSPSAKLPKELAGAIFTELAGLPPEPKVTTPAAIEVDTRRYAGSYASAPHTMTVTPGKAGHIKLAIRAGDSPAGIDLTLRGIAPDVFAVVGAGKGSPLPNGARILFLGDRAGRAEYCRTGVRMSRRIWT